MTDDTELRRAAEAAKKDGKPVLGYYAAADEYHVVFFDAESGKWWDQYEDHEYGEPDACFHLGTIKQAADTIERLEREKAKAFNDVRRDVATVLDALIAAGWRYVPPDSVVVPRETIDVIRSVIPPHECKCGTVLPVGHHCYRCGGVAP